jgi:hypothetical protein
MSQNDFSLANQSGAAFRADLNNALQALASASSGSSAPTTTYAHQIWLDTTTATAPIIKQRNSANDAWKTIGTVNADGSISMAGTAAFDIPVGTTAQRPGSPSEGQIRRNTTLSSFEGYTGSIWAPLGGGATGGGADQCFINNSNVITTSYTQPANTNSVSTGPITINASVTVTIAGSWVVL